MERLTDTEREYRERKHNETAKKMAKTITKNLYTYLCIAIPFLLIATIWTDFTLPEIGWNLLGDGVLTVVLMVIGERLMVRVGTFGGKLDDEYTQSVKRYKEARASAKKKDLSLMTPYCEWQIDQEFERARRARCSRLRIKYEDYMSKYEGHSLDELKTMLPYDKAIVVYQINQMEPIVLTPDMLLYDYGGRQYRRDIPESGEEYENKKIVGLYGLIVSIVTCLICVGLPTTWGGYVTPSKIIYTIGKLIVLLFRMSKGYSSGAKAYHTVEVKYLDAKSDYLEEFVDFIDKKTYIKISEEYPEIKRIIGEEKNAQIPCIESDQKRIGESDLRSQFNTIADQDCA